MSRLGKACAVGVGMALALGAGWAGIVILWNRWSTPPPARVGRDHP